MSLYTTSYTESRWPRLIQCRRIDQRICWRRRRCCRTRSNQQTSDGPLRLRPAPIKHHRDCGWPQLMRCRRIRISTELSTPTELPHRMKVGGGGVVVICQHVPRRLHPRACKSGRELRWHAPSLMLVLWLWNGNIGKLSRNCDYWFSIAFRRWWSFTYSLFFSLNNGLGEWAYQPVIPLPRGLRTRQQSTNGTSFYWRIGQPTRKPTSLQPPFLERERANKRITTQQSTWPGCKEERQAGR